MSRITPTLLVALLLTGVEYCHAEQIVTLSPVAEKSSTAAKYPKYIKNSEWQVESVWQCDSSNSISTSYWYVREKHQFTSLEGIWPEQWEVKGSWQQSELSVNMDLLDAHYTNYSGDLNNKRTKMKGTYTNQNGGEGCWSAIRLN